MENGITGELSEIIIFDREVVEKYLGTKYAISVSHGDVALID